MLFRSIVLVFLSLFVNAQSLRFERFTTTEGLLSDEVYNLCQDKKGFIWIFTNYGCLKYNGFEFKQVLQNLNIDEAFVYSYYEHRSGRKWIATSKGNIYEVRNDSAFSIAGTQDVSLKLRNAIHEILDLVVDDSLNIYAITKQNCYKFVLKDSSYVAYNLSPGKADSIKYIVHDNDKFVMGIHNFTGDDSTFCGGSDLIRMKRLMPSDTIYYRIQCMVSSIKHFKRFGRDLYFGLHDYLVKLSGHNVKYIPIGTPVLNFNKDRNNHMWVATYNNGLIELNENDSIVDQYFRNITVHDVLIDSQDGLWVSTAGLGLFHSIDLNHKYYEPPHGLSNPVTLIKETSLGLFIGNSAGQLFLLKESNKNPVLIDKGKSDELIDVAVVDRKIYLLFRFSMRILTFNENKNTFALYHEMELNAHKLLVKDDTLFIIHRKKITFLKGTKVLPFCYFNQRIYSASVFEGDFLVAMEDGIHLLRENGFSQVQEDVGQVRIGSITLGPDNSHYLTSAGHGVFKMSGFEDVENINESDGLPANIINSVKFGKEGVLLGTNKGLYYCPHPFLTGYKWQKIYDGNIAHASFFGSRIYIGTVKGLLYLDIAKIRKPSGIHFQLADIRINGKTATNEKLQELKHFENNIEATFDLITFDKEMPGIKYSLIGPYSDSGLVYSNVLKFSHLPYGTYVLAAIPVRVSDGFSPVVQKFKITPAFWQTRWFISLVVVATLIMILSGGYLVGNYYRRKRDRRVDAENKLLEYKLVALKAQINPHFMSNCLSAIQHLIISNKVDEATDYIAKFGFLVRQILNYSDRSIISLSDEVQLARLYMDLEQLRFERHFKYEIVIDKEIDPKNLYIPALILNPIIENAIWHGLLPLKNSRLPRILIRAELKSGNLHLSVIDNGVGRQSGPADENTRRQSKGTGLIEQRLQNLNRLQGSTESRIEYADLTEGGRASGTKVSIVLPVNLHANVSA